MRMAPSSHLTFSLLLLSVGCVVVAPVASSETIMAWGSNEYGQCDAPVGEDFATIAAGFYHSLAIRTDGSLYIRMGFQ